MEINLLKLKNFRNYDSLDIELSKGLNIFIGNNAQGKSNILESIFVLSLTKSYMNVKEQNLIKYNSDFSLIKGSFSYSGINNTLEVITTLSGKKLKINGVEIKKYSDYVSRVKVLIFSPYNINFVKEGPNVRRKSIKMVNVLNDSNSIYWEQINNKFCDLAVDIMLIRHNYVVNINKYLKDVYKEITDYDNLEFCYIPSFNTSDFNDIKNIFKEKLKMLYEREKMYGMTLIGPHRDDFSFLLDGKDLSIYGSQGQIRSAILSLKLSEVFLFKEVDDDYPILLLDDIFSELDVEKRNRLVKYIMDDVETIITTTDIHMIDKALVKKAKVFTVCDGRVLDKEGMMQK